MPKTSTVKINVPQPSYENLSVVGTFRAGIGTTTETGSNLLLTLDVGAISTTGIGSTLFEVSSFKIARPGYGFKIGDKFKPVGLVTAKGLSAPLRDFELTVLDVFTDSFSFWQFGELDYIDNIKPLQDGICNATIGNYSKKIQDLSLSRCNYFHKISIRTNRD